MPKKKKNTKAEYDKQFEAKPANFTLGDILATKLNLGEDIEPEVQDSTSEVEVQKQLLNDCDRAVIGVPFRIKRSKKGNLPISYENRNKGKKVTVISNITGNGELLLSELKRALGCGGIFRDSQIELQGDRREFLEKFLRKHPSIK